MQFNFQLSLISGPRGLPASHWEDYSSQLYCQCWWFCHEVDCHGNWSFGPWMVQPGIAFTLELSLYKYIQKGSKTDYPWQKFLRQSTVNRVKWRGKMVLNDAHKKEKWEVAHEKKRAVGSSPSSERNLYHQRKETPLLKRTMNICWASFVYQGLCWQLHIQHFTELLQADYETKDAILIFLFCGGPHPSSM